MGIWCYLDFCLAFTKTQVFGDTSSPLARVKFLHLGDTLLNYVIKGDATDYKGMFNLINGRQTSVTFKCSC